MTKADLIYLLQSIKNEDEILIEVDAGYAEIKGLAYDKHDNFYYLYPTDS